MDSGEENFYYSSGGGEEDIILSEPEEEADLAGKNYIILNETDIKQRLEEDISRICSVLSVSNGVACVLLYQYRWSVGSVEEEWFGDEEKVRKVIGFSEEEKKLISKKIICSICFEETRGPSRILTAACGTHPFCIDCWKIYISTSINGGPGCLTLCCPDPNCGSVVDRDKIEFLSSEKDKERYYKYLVRSYVEDSKERKWCPAPGCDFAVQYDTGSLSRNENEKYHVTCDCTFQFCWNCLEERHRPADCDTVRKWDEKNNSEAENTTWILAYTKPCPKCKRAIEKNQGCNHMTCRSPCGFEFCWVCLEPYRDHGSCNRFANKDDRDKEIAKKYMEKYAHYYERWAANHKSREIALADLKRAETEQLQKLAVMHGASDANVAEVTRAWEQIVECRHVLKWTYAYGYYIPEDETKKMHLFEFLQGQAESTLEKLHRCCEKDMKVYLESNERMDGFNEFLRNLKGLTNVTRDHFKKLVAALESGLLEIVSFGNGSTSRCASKSRSKKARRR